MGCKAICGGNKHDNNDSSQESNMDHQQGLQIIINYPKGKRKPFQVYYQDMENQEAPLIEVMNTLTFGKGQNVKPKFDGNFISIYNAQNDRYHYFCHRLLDIEIDYPENPYQGKIWVPYINKVKMDWDDMIENNYKISLVNTKLEWKLEIYNDSKNIDFKNTNSKQQSTVISTADIQFDIQQQQQQYNGNKKSKQNQNNNQIQEEEE